MISDLFKKNTAQNSDNKISIDDFLEDDVQIEIQSPAEQLENINEKDFKTINPLDSQEINPDFLMRDYENIKLLSMNPQVKKKITDLISDSKEDMQKLLRLLNNFHS
jgi:hypothetical protein